VEVLGQNLSRKTMLLFRGYSECETKDLGNVHSLLDMTPSRARAPRLVPNLLRGASSQASSDLYMESLVQRYGQERTAEILAASNVNLAIFPNLLIIGIQLRVAIPVSATRPDVHPPPTTVK